MDSMLWNVLCVVLSCVCLQVVINVVQGFRPDVPEESHLPPGTSSSTCASLAALHSRLLVRPFLKGDHFLCDTSAAGVNQELQASLLPASAVLSSTDAAWVSDTPGLLSPPVPAAGASLQACSRTCG